MKNKLIFTIDLEWYYNGIKRGRENIADFSKKSLKDRITYDNGQIEKSVKSILTTLQKYNQKITFYTVAEIWEAYPHVIETIYKQGNEIALHTYRHDTLTDTLNFERDLEKSVKFQRKYNIIGFRNTRINTSRQNYKSLAKYGYKHDSSVYGTTRFKFSGINILPVSVLPYGQRSVQSIPSNLNIDLIKKSVPFGSGVFAGLLQKYDKYFIDMYYSRYQEPPCIFIHSWQIEQPHYPVQFLIKNPFMVPYSFECKNMLEYFCKKYQLVKVKDYSSYK